MPKMTTDQMESMIRTYMDACTSGNADAIAATLSKDAVHYFPPDMYDGPWKGGRYIAERWADFVGAGGSSWTVDAVVVDAERCKAACEWTHFKGKADVILRGAEFYDFSEDGLITEIRAYYASPQSKSLNKLELGGFDYTGRGYAMSPPNR